MGRAIQVVRTDRGWSRRDLAQRTGLSYSFLSEIENGVKEPSTKTFMRICVSAGVRGVTSIVTFFTLYFFRFFPLSIDLWP